MAASVSACVGSSEAFVCSVTRLDIKNPWSILQGRWLALAGCFGVNAEGYQATGEMSAGTHRPPDTPPRLKKSYTHVEQMKGISPSDDTVDSAGTVTDEGPWSYPMREKHKGLFVIFNHEHFDHHLRLEERNGTTKDKTDLEKVWEDLGFIVEIHNDLTHHEVQKKILKYSSHDLHSKYDCFACAVLTHGDEGDRIYAKDKAYKAEELFEAFRDCKSLVGKPKLFFIQACRGSVLDPGNRVEYDTTDAGPSHKEGLVIPKEADFLIAHSTVSGYFSWRNPCDGSWFIQTLNKCLRSYSTKHDLMTILTTVNREVSKKESSTNLKEYKGKKQCPSIVSRLTGLVFLIPTSKRRLETGDALTQPQSTLNAVNRGVSKMESTDLGEFHGKEQCPSMVTCARRLEGGDAPAQLSAGDPQPKSVGCVVDSEGEKQEDRKEYYRLKLELLKKESDLIPLKERLYKMKLNRPHVE